MGRRLGQHFLADRATAAAIAASAEVADDEPLLEIGGGRGALTEHLTGLGARRVVVELDRGLAPKLRERYPAIEVLEADVLEVDLAALGPGPWVVLGNLPYYVTSSILQWLVAQADRVDRAVLMMQEEVADRLAAEPGTKAYGRLTVMVRYRATVEKLRRVPPGSFKPPPKVNSAVVRIRFQPEPAVAVADERRFFALVEHGFRWRRKTLTSVLKRWRGMTAEEATAQLAAAGIDPLRRAETLDLEEFARLSDALGEPR